MSNVILIGYMGCGKSTIGKRLSYVLKQPFEDTDKLIEMRQKRTISDIFATDGEAVFRDMETECIKSLFDNKQDYVIAVGGGLPIRESNRALLKELGLVVYLRAKPDTIYIRLKDDTTRPLLQGDNPQQKIIDMIAQRGPFYEEGADVIIDVDDKSFDQIVLEIKNAVKENSEKSKVESR